jgi:putative ABC transport system ATP-binding protein
MEPAIRIRNLNHYFGTGALRRQILFDISADIFPGEIVINTGPSGSGKTTLLTLVSGLRTVREGSVRTLDAELNGAATTVLDRVRRSIGFIFQAHKLLGIVTACENVEMGLQFEKGLSRREARRRAIDMLTAVGLENHIDRYPAQLSGGQQQRVAIARALARRPTIILADEPTAALDKSSGREVVDLLHRLAKQQGCAILLVTHDNRILDVADRILTLEDGRISSFASGIRSNTERLLAAFSGTHRKGELRRHLQDLPDQEFARALDDVTVEFEQLLKAMDLANADATSSVLNEVLEGVAARIRSLLHADRTTVYLVDHEHRQLYSKVAHHTGEEPLEVRLPIGVGIAGHVAQTGESMNIADPQHHPHFNPDIDRRTGYRTRSLLCIPIRSRAGAIIGVAQVLNKVDKEAFGPDDENVLQDFAPSLGVILQTCSRLLSVTVTRQA